MMVNNSNKLNRFWQELKRRKVIYVITVYASASFVIIELVNNVLEPLNLPENLSKIVIIALAVGFPIVLVLSWIFDVTPKGIEKTGPADVEAEGKKEVPSNSWRIATYASVVIIAGLIIFNIFARTGLMDEVSQYGKSIAILPFVNETHDPDKESLVFGTMQSIRNKLCKLSDLRVLSLKAVEPYRDTVVPIPVIATALGAGYILDCSVQQAGDHIRMTVGLSNHQGQLVWSEEYDRDLIELTNLFDLQSEIALLVAEEIHSVITPEEMQRIKKIPTLDPLAHQLYNKGLQSFLQYMNYWNMDDLDRARSFYEQALVHDSTYAEAIVGLGEVYWIAGKATSVQRYRDSILMYAERALSYDSQCEYAYTLRSRYFFPWGPKEDEMDCYNKALETNPNLALAYIWRANCYHFFYTDYLNALKDCEAAEQRKQGELVPVAFYNMFGWTYEDAGFPEMAKAYYQKAIPFAEDSSGYYSQLSGLEGLKGNHNRAIEFQMKAMQIDSTRKPHFWNFQLAGRLEEAYHWAKIFPKKHPASNSAEMGYILNENGDTSRAMPMFRRTIDEYENRDSDFRAGDIHFPAAQVYAYLGEKDKAYEVLEEIVDNRNSFYINRLDAVKHSPIFDNLRGEERFESLLRTMETKWQTEHERVRIWLQERGKL